jgi:membrane-bound lytic murein transglycosylase D
MASKNLPRLHRVATTDYKTHTIAKRESLSQVCNRYDINKTTLLKVNNLRSQKLIAGQRLRIPYQTVRYQLLPEGSNKTVANQDNLVLHRIKKGETISQIAHKYKVPVELIISWNDLPNIHTIQIGHQLSLYLEQRNVVSYSSKADPIAFNNQNNNIIILAAQTKKIPAEVVSTITANKMKSAKKSQNGWYQVQHGDTLWTIAKGLKLSHLQIKQWNNLQSNLIHPGKRLKIKDA